MKFYHVKNFFDLHTFDNETTTTEIHFVSLAFLNDEDIITTSLLFIHLKCTIMHYVNLNSSSMNKPLLRAVEYDISLIFFGLLIYVYFDESFVKSFIKKLSFCNVNFQNSFQDVLYYILLGCQTL